MQIILLSLYKKIKELSISPSDSEEERIKKSTFALIAVLKCGGCIAWAIMYALLGLTTSALFPLFFSFIIFLGILFYFRTKKYTQFTNVTLFFMMIIPIGLQLHLGGFTNSGIVMVWSFLAPIGALVFRGSQQAKPWFALFSLLLIVTVVIDGFLPETEPRPEWMLGLFLIMNIGAVSAIVFATTIYFVKQVKTEQAKSDSLLLNILPFSIVKRIKSGEKMIADQVDNATVLFADLAGFTQYSATLTAREVIEMLNSVFSEFDKLVEHYKLEKIKTIGDAYMVVGGLTSSDPNHCERMANMALDMMKVVAQLKKKYERLEIRIGIHSGEVIAGIIGMRKFSFDVWGDAVNTASRMESHGESGKIQVSESIFKQLKKQFKFQERGKIEIKGKGEMQTFFLIDSNQDLSIEAEQTQ